MVKSAVVRNIELEPDDVSTAAVAIPRRHGADPREGRRMAKPVSWLIRGRDPEPSPEQWQALGEALLEGDPAADRLVTWMHQTGMNAAMPLFERALERGIASVPNAPAALREFFAVVDARPAWVDERLLVEGARVSHISGLTGMRTMRDLALMAGYQASAINRTLVLTGALQRGAQRRLAETTKWWLDATADDGMARDANGFKTTLRVRLIHALLRKRVAAMPEWDTTELGLPINQADMHATYLGFSVVFLFGQRLMGVPLRQREAEAVMHLWRYIGWLMGVDERWLCLSEMDGRVALYRNLLSQAPPDDSSVQLGRALMDEPLSRHYPRFAWLRGHFERSRHLSICRMFLGAEGMKALGLPRFVLPWYPLLSAPLVATRQGVLRLLPGGRERLIRAGRAAQVDYLKVLFGHSRPDIGGHQHVP
ncbi:MAG: oxygenase MpaB family protein [Stenotrophobium sp.]